MSSLYAKVDLGVSSVISASRINIRGERSLTLGKFFNAYDLQNPIYLNNRPVNNTVSVKIIDNLTGNVNIDEYDYVLQLFFERVG